MWEKLEPIVQHEMDIEWESVIAILFLKSYEQADIMLNRFLLRHSQNDDTIIVKLCILFRDESFYHWVHSGGECGTIDVSIFR